MQGKIRFAPSPTGYLHEGHLLSALYVWAAARKWDLKIHLRIEDHDQSRARPAYIESIYEDLDWLGFHYDSKSIQSERGEYYEKALAKLQSQNLVYPCYCSRKQLEAENPRSETGEIIYQGKCRCLDERRDTQHLEQSTLPHNLRFKVADKIISWTDLRLGEFHENPKEQCGDFPIRDRDNQWTYQFAVCVDDIEEGITHIVRGEDIRNSTARQILLMETLGRTAPPVYLHHGLIVDKSGRKLSKREHDFSLRQSKEQGATPEQLFGEVCFKADLQQTPDSLSLKGALSLIVSYL